MKIKFLFFTIAFLFFYHSGWSQSKNQIKDRKIKSTQTHISDYRKENSNRVIFTKYDKAGNPIEVKEYKQDSTFIRWEKTTFNSNSDVLISISLGKDGQTLEKTEISYNSFEQPIEQKVTNGEDQLVEMIKFEYNQFGHKTIERQYNKDEKLVSYSKYVYDQKDMLVRKEIYNAKDELLYIKEVKYTY